MIRTYIPFAAASKSAKLIFAATILLGSIVAVPTTAQTAATGTTTEAGTPIRITVGDVVMTGRFNATSMAQRMVERLPLTLMFGNHSIDSDDFPTKVTHLDPELPTEGTELGGAPGTGDIAHYVPNGNFGFYYGQLQYWPGVVTLGTFDGDPDVFARQTGPFEVTIEVAED